MRESNALYEKIQAYSFDEPGTRRTFVARLAEEQGWSRSYAERVVAEYRKFLFLAVAAGHCVSPSHDVDQAWHLHLCDTRNYWLRFCPEVVGRPLHHEPSRGTRAEDRKFRVAYARTLASYRAFFGIDPPEDLWPRHRRLAVPGFLALASPLLLTGCEETGSKWGVIAAFAVAVLIFRALAKKLSGAERGSGGSGGCGGDGVGCAGSDAGGGGGDAGCGGGGCGDGGGCGGGCGGG